MSLAYEQAGYSLGATEGLGAADETQVIAFLNDHRSRQAVQAGPGYTTYAELGDRDISYTEELAVLADLSSDSDAPRGWWSALRRPVSVRQPEDDQPLLLEEIWGKRKRDYFPLQIAAAGSTALVGAGMVAMGIILERM